MPASYVDPFRCDVFEEGGPVAFRYALGRLLYSVQTLLQDSHNVAVRPSNFVDQISHAALVRR
jgi:hypothetical protein